MDVQQVVGRGVVEGEEVDRTTGARGPSVTDPSYYDGDTQRWFQVVLTLDTNPATGALTGPNHLDMAVSTTAEYTAQTCTLTLYTTAPFGSCGGTRASLGNWATHISKVTP